MKIRRTAHGIPHIIAKTFYGGGYGYGYAFAQDNLCAIAETYVTVDGERSRYFGPDGTLRQPRQRQRRSTTSTRDFFFQRIIDDGDDREAARRSRRRAGRSREIQEGVRGYVAGYNRYLRDDRRAPTSPTRRCRGKAWVRPITEIDVYRRFYQLGAARQPGRRDRRHRRGAAADRPPVRRRPPAAQQHGQLARRSRSSCRSAASARNAVALGKDATDNGHGMLLGNPHFPWDGPERFYQAQLTIPGKLDVERRQPVRRAARPDRPHATTWPGATRSRPRTASRRSS